MGENTDSHQGKDTGFKKFAAMQMLLWMIVAVAVIAGVGFVIRFLEISETTQMAMSENVLQERDTVHSSAKEPSLQTAAGAGQTAAGHIEGSQKKAEVKTTHGAPAFTSQTAGAPPASAPVHKTESSAGTAAAQKTSPAHQAESVKSSKTAKASPTTHAAAPDQEGHAPDGVGKETFPVVGMAFVNAVIKPLDYELNTRAYGWRPNDIVNVTDNVNNFQLGVLEVTRRSAVILAERISRTGSTAAFDKNLENAMNWFMIKADRYWFPSAESKYNAGLNELRIYFNKLKEGNAAFYTRTDNLIPLLAAYEDLLGSCDQNLVKVKEADGSSVSTFKADNYFFYAKGVVSAMVTILEAIQEDFNIMVSREGGMEVLQHAIESCHHAVDIDPWIVLESSPGSIFANHRTNMAAPISHARFYLGVLIKALST